MPQLMPLYWMFSMFMFILVVMVMVCLFFFKNKVVDFVLMNKYNMNMSISNYLW